VGSKLAFGLAARKAMARRGPQAGRVEEPQASPLAMPER
jgi:hypothetical protein